MSAVAIVPAAGKGERFGGSKLTALVAGEPLLTHTLRSLLDAGVARVIVVTAPGAALEHVTLLDDPRVTRVENPDPSRGMFSSIQAGVAAAEGDPILVLPGDMPFVRSATIARVQEAAATSGHIVSPRFGGRHGHPVALPASLRHDILNATPDMTLARLIDGHGIERVYVEVDDRGIVRDVDVPGDLTP